MYLMYIMMFIIAVAATFSPISAGTVVSRSGESNMLEREAVAMLTQMHYYHMAAYQKFEDCMKNGTCTDGVVDPKANLPDTMINAGAFSSDRFISFIVADASVSNSSMDGILVTVWAEGVKSDHPAKGLAYRMAHNTSNSHYIGGRAVRNGGTYRLKVSDKTELRTNERLYEATFGQSDLPLGNLRPDNILVYYSAGSHVY